MRAETMMNVFGAAARARVGVSQSVDGNAVACTQAITATRRAFER